MGMIEKAREEFEEVTFRSDQLKEEYRKKIEKIGFVERLNSI
jgi:hypothetical protein